MKRLIYGILIFIVGILVISLYNIIPTYATGFIICALGMLIIITGIRDIIDKKKEGN